MKKKILITGATGNVGLEVIRALFEANCMHTIVAGVRNIEKAKAQFMAYPQLEYVFFDFEAPETFHAALEQVDRVFLLRPPQLSDTKRYFKPLISAIRGQGIRELLFLSVQGAETSKFIPHHKIEQLVLESRLDYIFLRPSYFMQNLTTTLLSGIRQKREILLPAGSATFNWIDVRNIGEAAARLLEQFEAYRGGAYELTGYENEDFYTVASYISQAIGEKVRYHSLNPFRFYYLKKREGVPPGMVLVMIMLHFVPRLLPAPKISGFYELLTGSRPTHLQAFLAREKAAFL